MIPTPKRFLQKISEAVGVELKKRGLDVVGPQKGKVASTYSSGNLLIQRATETTGQIGTKRYRIVQPYGNRNAAPAASDALEYQTDINGNRVGAGKIVDVGSAVVDADYFMGLRPVAPGNTLLLSHDAEINTTSATFVDTANKFQVTRPGLYRMKVELARSGGTARARAVRKLKDGTVVALTADATQSTLTYPTFGAVQTLDFTTPVDWGDVIYMQLANDSGPAQTAYAQNCRIYYTDATATFTLYDAAL